MSELFSALSNAVAVIVYMFKLPIVMADRLYEAMTGFPLSAPIENPAIPALVAVVGLIMVWRPMKNVCRSIFSSIPMIGMIFLVMTLYVTFTAFNVLGHNTLFAAYILMTAAYVYGRRYLLARDLSIP